MFSSKSFDLFRSFDQSRSNRSIDPKNRSLKMEQLEERHLLSVSPLDFAPQTMDSSVSFDEMTEQEQAAFTAETLRSRLQGYGVNTMVSPLVFGPLTYVQQQAISSGLAVRSASQSDYSLLNDGEFSSVFVVDTLQDVISPTDGKVSLREAILSANFFAGHDLITFVPGLTGTILLNGTALPTIFESVNIKGPGADVLTIDAGGRSRIFVIIGGGDQSAPMPSIPGGLSGEASLMECSVTLTWNAAENATFYAIYRQDTGSEWKFLNITTTTSFTDNTAKQGTTYEYRLVAANMTSGQMSQPSSPVSVTTAAGLWIDLDIDSDNNSENHYGLPENSTWEEEIEDYLYGLGKVLLPNHGDRDRDGRLDCWDGYSAAGYTQGSPNASEPFVPITITIPSGVNLEDIRIQFDFPGMYGHGLSGSSNPSWLPTGAPGSIRIWNEDGDMYRNASNIIIKNNSYDPEHLGFTNEIRTITLYVEGMVENENIKYYEDVLDGAKQDTKIKVSLIDVRNGGWNVVAEDAALYVVAAENTFYHLMATNQDVRAAAASAGIYGRHDLPNFGLKLSGGDPFLAAYVNSHVDFEFINGNWVVVSNGFNAGVYLDHTSQKNLVTFQGTDVYSPADWDTNFSQYFYGNATQYESAMEIGLWIAQHGIVDDVIFTGHSLGGGLASAATFFAVPTDYTRKLTYTFNAAYFWDGTGNAFIDDDHLSFIFTFRDNYARAQYLILAFIVDGEALDSVQQLVEVRANGGIQKLQRTLTIGLLESITTLDPIAFLWSPVKRGLLHTNQYVLEGLEFFYGVREWPENG